MDVASLYDCFAQSCWRDPDARCARWKANDSAPEAEPHRSDWATYRQVGQGSVRLAEALRRDGLAAGECVAVYASWSVEVLWVHLAASRLQLVLLPLASACAPDEVAAAVRRHRARVLFVAAELFRDEWVKRNQRVVVLPSRGIAVPAAAVSMAALLHADPAAQVSENDPAAMDIEPEWLPPDEDTPNSLQDPYVIARSAGITHAPREVLLHNRHVLQAARALQSRVRYRSRDVVCLLTESLCHPFFLAHLWALLHAGAAVGTELCTLDNIRKMDTSVLVGSGCILSYFFDALLREGEKLRGLPRRLFKFLVQQPAAVRLLADTPPKRSGSGGGAFVRRNVMRSLRDSFLPRYRLTVSGMSTLTDDTRQCLERLLLEPVLDVYGVVECCNVLLCRQVVRGRYAWLPLQDAPSGMDAASVQMHRLFADDSGAEYGEVQVRVGDVWDATEDIARLVPASHGRGAVASDDAPIGTLVDRKDNLVMCMEEMRPHHLTTMLPQNGMVVETDNGALPFLSMALLEWASRRSRFVRQSWMFFHTPEPTIVAVLVPARDAALEWHRVQLRKQGLTWRRPVDVDAERQLLQELCADRKFREAVLSDVRSALLRYGAISEEWFDALLWEMVLEPAVDRSFLDLAFTPHNGLLSEAFELRRGALRRHYADKLGAQLEAIAGIELLRAEESSEEEVEVEVEGEAVSGKAEEGAEAEASLAAAMQRWLLQMWSTFRNELSDAVLAAEASYRAMAGEGAATRPRWRRRVRGDALVAADTSETPGAIARLRQHLGRWADGFGERLHRGSDDSTAATTSNAEAAGLWMRRTAHGRAAGGGHRGGARRRRSRAPPVRALDEMDIPTRGFWRFPWLRNWTREGAETAASTETPDASGADPPGPSLWRRMRQAMTYSSAGTSATSSTATRAGAWSKSPEGAASTPRSNACLFSKRSVSDTEAEHIRETMRRRRRWRRPHGATGRLARMLFGRGECDVPASSEPEDAMAVEATADAVDRPHLQ
ncbi:hypothetical protein CDCA_CDCA15G4033 [Cyanidium caldarium]|uniref:AMP-dependent synthetase/ligase domain-containing protein n=1 Tax=Cyanidium caldarium TaxID=2771 RepID=A0AAV9J1U7_CYACA|nr:hypothetical protein CDCA_CDCA15G4033 [Cyanidium caldarium]